MDIEELKRSIFEAISTSARHNDALHGRHAFRLMTTAKTAYLIGAMPPRFFPYDTPVEAIVEIGRTGPTGITTASLSFEWPKPFFDLGKYIGICVTDPGPVFQTGTITPRGLFSVPAKNRRPEPKPQDPRANPSKNTFARESWRKTGRK